MTDSSARSGADSFDVVGTVSKTRCYPVKSMDAEDLPAVRVLADGVEHDREWMVVDADGGIVTTRSAPQLADVRVGEILPDGPQLWLPGAELAVRAASADAALSGLVGEPVVLTHLGDRTDAERAGSHSPVHLVSQQQIAAAQPAGVNVTGAVSAPEPRANVVLDLTATSDETQWLGREVQVGEAVLVIRAQPRNCLGVYADVVQPGIVAVGDPIRLR
ncbi:MAG: MOSC N-terminal beta barrel domain-containing protein [Actinomycetota bacterium]